MAELPKEIVTSVAIGNLKAISEQPAMLSNLAYSNTVANTNLSQQNAVANQQAMNELGIAVTGKTTAQVSNLGPLEARSAVDVLTNNELAQTIADLKAAVQAFAGSSSSPSGRGKGGGNTSGPPVLHGKDYVLASTPVNLVVPGVAPNEVTVTPSALPDDLGVSLTISTTGQ